MTKIRFVAQFVSGENFERAVFYNIDGGTDRDAIYWANTTNQNGNWNFDGTKEINFSQQLRVFVNVNQGTIFHEELYVDDQLVASGNAGDEGITVIRQRAPPIIPPAPKPVFQLPMGVIIPASFVLGIFFFAKLFK